MVVDGARCTFGVVAQKYDYGYLLQITGVGDTRCREWHEAPDAVRDMLRRTHGDYVSRASRVVINLVDALL